MSVAPLSATLVPQRVVLHVNGREHLLDVPLDAPLLNVLRNDLGLNGPKYGCGLGECGACAVLMDGQSVCACVLPVRAAVGHAVMTLEGLGTRLDPHPVQQAYIDEQAAQCGYCLNGMIIATVALLSRCRKPSDEQVREALSRHLCRCGTHVEILRAVQRAVALMAAADEGAR